MNETPLNSRNISWNKNDEAVDRGPDKNPSPVKCKILQEVEERGSRKLS